MEAILHEAYKLKLGHLVTPVNLSGLAPTYRNLTPKSVVMWRQGVAMGWFYHPVLLV